MKKLYRNYGKELLSKLVSSFVYHENAPIRGCTEEEIEAVKVFQEVSYIPEVYRQFLSVCGHGAGELFGGEDYSYGWLPLLKRHAKELAMEPLPSFLIPDDALVIQGHQGYAFTFVETINMDDNPKVYEFYEGSMEKELIAESLIKYYNDAIERRILLRKNELMNRGLR